MQPLFNDFAQNYKAPFPYLLFAEKLFPKTQHLVALPVLEALQERNVPHEPQSTQDFIWIHCLQGSEQTKCALLHPSEPCPHKTIKA